ncbi:MAG: flagellar basal-body MS-ring/collar protein FliF, partial [Acetanaerobacterium sp.]
GQRTMYLSVLGGIVILAIALSVVLNFDSYVVIAQGLDSSQSSEMIAMLQESGVDVRVEGGGVIKVPKDAESQALMDLSIAGYQSGTANYDIFSTNVGFTSTEFEKNQYLRFQTEANIRSAIMTIPRVKDASVSIAMADGDQYVLSTERIETKASAKVDMYTGFELTAAQVKGIESYIASSVPGLTTENISVVDGTGKLLNSGDSEFDESSENKLRLSYERQVEENLKSKVQDILSGPFGTNGVSVAVTVVLDYDKMISEEMSYIPSVDDKGIVSHEETADSTQDQTQDGGVPGVEDNAEVPTYPDVAAANGSQSTSNARSVDYLVSYIKTQNEKNGTQRKAVSISVMVNREVMTDTDRDSLIGAVAMAAGVDPSNVSILNLKFAESEGVIGSDPVLDTNMLMIAGGAGLALVLLIILAIVLIARSRRRKRENEALSPGMAGGGGDISQYFGDKTQAHSPIDLGIAKLEVTDTKELALKREIQNFSKENPDIAAQLLRTWLKGDEDDGFY